MSYPVSAYPDASPVNPGTGLTQSADGYRVLRSGLRTVKPVAFLGRSHRSRVSLSAAGVQVIWLAAILLLSAIGRLSGAQPGSIDSSFVLGNGFDYSVQKIAVQADDRVVATGSFNTYNGTPVPGVVRILPNGSLDKSFKYTGDEYFGSVLELGRDGHVLLMGTFLLQDHSNLERLVRLKTNGTVEKVYATQPSSADQLSLLHVMSDGSLVVGGTFTRFMGNSRINLARIRADGTLDSAYNPAINFSSSFVDSFLELPGGDLLLQSAAWRPRNDPDSGVLRLRPDGTLNPVLPYIATRAFSPFLLWDGTLVFNDNSNTPFNRYREDAFAYPCFGVGNVIGGEHLVTLSDGRILMAPVNGAEDGTVIRLFADGTIDPTFKFEFSGGQVRCAKEAADGNYWIAGDFYQVNHEFASGLVKVLADDDSGKTQVRFNGAHFGVFETEGRIRVPVVRSGVISNRVEVTFRTTSAGTAVPSKHYVETHGTLIFEPGQRLASFEVKVLNDGLVKPILTIGLQLEGQFIDAAGATAEVCLAGEIGTVQFQASTITVNESDWLAGVPIVRSGGPLNTVGIPVIVIPGTAGPHDYVEYDSTAYMAAGATVGYAAVKLLDNQTVEGPREFTVKLGSMPNGFVPGAADTMRVVIEDNDLPGFPGDGLNMPAATLWPTPDGGVLLSGNFTNVCGAVRPGIAKLDANGLLTGMFSDYPYQLTRILDAQADGRMILETATNGFPRAGVSPQPPIMPAITKLEILAADGNLLGSLARTNRTLGAALIPGGGWLRATARPQFAGQSGEYWLNFTEHRNDGGVITNQETSLGSFFGNFQGYNTPCVNLKLMANGSTIVSGPIRHFGNQNFIDSQLVFRLDGNRKLDPGFSTYFPGQDIYPYGFNFIRTWSLANRILVAGPIDYSDSELLSRVDEIQEDGNVALEFNPEPASTFYTSDYYANSIAVTSDQKILVPWLDGGSHRLYRLLATGAIDRSFSTNVITDRAIESLTVVADGRIVISGGFTTVAGAHRMHLAWLSPDGQILPNRPIEITSTAPLVTGKVRLKVNSRRSALGIVEHSSDLQTWLPVGQYLVPLGASETEVDVSGVSPNFFRVKLTK